MPNRGRKMSSIFAGITVAGLCVGLVACGSGKGSTPTTSPVDANGTPIFLVSLSGDGKDPINQVYGATANSQIVPDVLDPAGLNFRKLRGMAWDSTGSLYVANGDESQILKFSRAGNRYANGSVFAPSTTPAIAHPYGLAFASDGDLLSSNQDTELVLRVSASGTPVPTATAWPSAFPNATFPPGMWVPPARAPRKETNSKISPVPASQGGLTEPRGIAIAGNTLFVADDMGKVVNGYNLATGAFTGTVATFTSGLPTGLAVSPDGSTLYISLQGDNTVAAVNIVSCLKACSTNTVVPADISGVKLDHPAGMAFGASENGSAVLFVASRKASAVNKYVLNGSSVQQASVFVRLPGQPEQLLLVN